MRRWGQITEPKTAEWYDATVKSVYKPEVYLAAAKHLLEEGHIEEADIPWDTDGYKAPTSDFIDGITYDGKDPIGYLNAHTIGNKDS
jgi:nitrate/nitrite transport system substrate-binding protein